MSTATVQHQPDSQEAMRGVYAAVLCMTADHHLPLPYGVGRNGAGSNLIAIELDSHAALRAWADTMRLADVDREPHANPKTGKTHLHATGNWAGWRVNLSSDEPLSAAQSVLAAAEREAYEEEARRRLDAYVPLAAPLPRRVPGAMLGELDRDGHVKLPTPQPASLRWSGTTKAGHEQWGTVSAINVGKFVEEKFAAGWRDLTVVDNDGDEWGGISSPFGQRERWYDVPPATAKTNPTDLRHTMLVKATQRDPDLADGVPLPEGVEGFGTADILAAETTVSAA